jgi:hypothetical protein
MAEIMMEARLHKGLRLSVERLACGAQHVMHDGRNGVDGRGGDGGALKVGVTLAAALLALATGDGVLTAGALALQELADRQRGRQGGLGQLSV